MYPTTPRTGGSDPERCRPAFPEPGAPPVEVRALRVSEYAADAARDAGVLSAEERERAGRFVRGADRDRYRTAHVALRHELAARTGLLPERLAFTRETCPVCGGPHGRPALAPTPAPASAPAGTGPANGSTGHHGWPGQHTTGGPDNTGPGPGVHPAGPHFSLSHAGDLVLLAFADQPVGVDVEQLPAPETVTEVATSLHPQERAELDELTSPAERAAAFARCWTRKEAYLKGTGAGLAEGLAATPVGTRTADPLAPPGWHLADLPVPDGYAAACAVRLSLEPPGPPAPM